MTFSWITSQYQCTRCGWDNDLLQAGHSGDWILLGARFSLPVQTGSRGPSILPYSGCWVFSRVVSGLELCLHLSFVPGKASHGVTFTSVIVQECTKMSEALDARVPYLILQE